MRRHQYIILGIILILFLLILIDIHVKYEFNGKIFKLRPDSDKNMKDKAKILFELKRRMDILVNHMKNNNIPNNISASRLSERFKNTELRETGLFETNTGYTLNKGREIRLCLNKSSKADYNTNIIMFILLHEMAHIMSYSYGHNDEFTYNMDVIVKTAVKLGLYTPIDYSINPVTYCGTYVTNSPCNNSQCLF